MPCSLLVVRACRWPPAGPRPAACGPSALALLAVQLRLLRLLVAVPDLVVRAGGCAGLAGRPTLAGRLPDAGPLLAVVAALAHPPPPRLLGRPAFSPARRDVHLSGRQGQKDDRARTLAAPPKPGPPAVTRRSRQRRRPWVGVVRVGEHVDQV